MRSPRPRGVDLDHHDLHAELRADEDFMCICVYVWICLSTDLSGLKSVDVCETKRDKRK